MATFLELKTDVNEIASRTVADYTYTALTAELNARLRLIEMEAATTIATVDGTASYALPSGFLEVIKLRTNSTPITIVDEHQIDVAASNTGRPVEAVIIKGNILLSPVPGDVYSVFLRYIDRLADLSGDNDTNDVLDNFYNIYLYGALKHWTALTRDMQQMQHWTGLFEEAIAQAETATMRQRYGAESAAVMPPARGAA